MDFEICRLLNIEYPIFQGAMAWVAESSLAGAVSRAGGLGIIAGGNAPAEVIRKEIHKLRETTDKPFAVNIMLLSPFADEMAQMVCEEKVPIVTTGAGNPGKYMESFKASGIKVIPVVPSVAIAKKMEKLGADALVAEGMEAGGHIGKLTTMVLVPQVVDAVQIPVIAAGGIADGRGMAAAFMLGAKGAQVGTRFLVAKECIVHDNYKKAVLKANDISTTVTSQITGHPVRVLRNKLSKLYDTAEREELRKEEPDIERIEKLGVGSLRKAVIDGDAEYGSLMSGQIAGLVNKEETAKEILESLMEGFLNLTAKERGL